MCLPTPGLRSFLYSNKRLALLGPQSLLSRYLCLPPFSYPANGELYNVASITSEPGLGVNDRATIEETEDPGGGVTDRATSEYTGDAGGEECGAIGDIGEYLRLGMTDCAAVEYIDDA